MKPDVLMLHPSDDWYGADRVALDTALAIRASGCSVTVLIGSTHARNGRCLSERLAVHGVPVRRISLPVLRRNRLRPVGLVRLLIETMVFAIRCVRWQRASLVYVNTSALALTVPVLRVFRRERVVAHAHETLTGFERSVLGSLMGCAHRVVAVSESCRMSFPNRIRNFRVNVVRNTVPDETPLRCIRLGERPLTFLFVGRLTPRKGIAELLSAWTQLPSGDRFLKVVGGAAQQGQSASVDWARVRRDPTICYVGEVDSAHQLMDEAHVVVVPSLMPEGLPLVAIEALSRGRPIVATDLGGLSELVDESVGWRLPAHRIQEWPAILASITLEDVVERQRACRIRYEDEFSKEAFELER